MIAQLCTKQEPCIGEQQEASRGGDVHTLQNCVVGEWSTHPLLRPYLMKWRKAVDGSSHHHVLLLKIVSPKLYCEGGA